MERRELTAARHVRMISYCVGSRPCWGEHQGAPRVAGRFGSHVLKHETAHASAPDKGCKKPHRGQRRWGVQKQTLRKSVCFRDRSDGYPLKCRGFPGIPALGGVEGKRRISDTRVLCVVVATQRGIAVFVAVETRARPVHNLARLTGARRPARTSAR